MGKTATSTGWDSPPSRGPIDFKTLRETIDSAEVLTRLLGPAHKRRGESAGKYIWWPCPLGTHEDSNPSFCLPKSGDKWRYWRCYGCGQSGDPIDLARAMSPGLSFPDAVALVTGNAAPPSRPKPGPARPAKADEPAGLSAEAAAALLGSAEASLWSADGAEALAYLRGRGLTDETIRAARLGWTPKADGVAWRPPCVVIPWFDGQTLMMIKVRPDDVFRAQFAEEHRPPKYLSAFKHPSRPLGLYPCRKTVKTGRPLIITEGELDALLLAQELEGIASVVTLGSASAHPDRPALDSLIGAMVWHVATDADQAGDNCAVAWLKTSPRARRARPPAPHKDWTDCHQAGANLRRWWTDRLSGIERPSLYSWDELATWRWGPTLEAGPGIVIPTRLISFLPETCTDAESAEDQTGSRTWSA